MRRRFFILAVWIGMAGPLHAALIERPLENAAQEQEAQQLFRELRCMVCEGQSLAESEAVLAVQMRAEVRRALVAGQKPGAILNDFQTRYSDRIRMTPPWRIRTGLLWVMPALLLALGSYLIWRATRNATAVPE